MMSNYSNRTGYAWQNIHRLFNALARAFSDRGVRVAMSFNTLEEPVDWLDPSVRCKTLQLNPNPKGFKNILRVVRVLRSERVRYLYLTDQRSVHPVYALYRLAGVKRILVHNRVSVADPRPIEKVDDSWRGKAKWVAARIPPISADRTYAVSDFVRRRLVLKARIPEDRVVTILNGIPLDEPLPASPRTSSDIVKIFAGSRASRVKGIQVLIRAAALLRECHGIHDFSVTYAGDGPDLDYLRKLVMELDLARHVHLIGEVPTTRPYLRESDIVVIPSVWGDACPSAVSEALASGVAVVATHVGGVPELVGSEHSAEMVSPGDPNELAAVLAMLIRNPTKRAALGERGRKRAVTALDETRYHEAVTQQTLKDCGLGVFGA